MHQIGAKNIILEKQLSPTPRLRFFKVSSVTEFKGTLLCKVVISRRQGHSTLQVQKFCLRFAVDWSSKYLPPVSFTPGANLPPVSLTPVANLPSVSTTLVKMVEKFAAGVVDTGWCTLTCEYLRVFSKKFKTVLMEYSGDGGETDSWKKPEATNLLTLSI
jgi:hypothetical protein